MSRNHLHVTHLEKFKKYLLSHSIPFREGKGEYQVLQVKVKTDWVGVFTRHEMKEHLTVDKRLDRTVADFYREFKGPRGVPVQEELPFD